MICVETDSDGRRTYRLPQALADVAMELFPGTTQCSAVFRLAKLLTWHDVHTVENIALNYSHAEAVVYARDRIGESARAVRPVH